MNSLTLQYLGFLNTPNLWLDTSDFGLQQFELIPTVSDVTDLGEHKLRLGKLVERFVSLQLQQDKSISILADNLQIQDNRITIGEIDCLIQQNKQPIHLEIVYKYYLYDETTGSSEIDHWIGPNRKDSFTQKLAKLKEKQLPLLYHNCTKTVLEKLNIQIEEIQQRVCFKAQLFVPLQKQNHTFKSINSSCIKGFYIKQNEVQQFADCQFYIPKKLDWLIDIPTHQLWQTYDAFLEELTPQLNQNTAPLCWIKKANGNTEKCFVVWW